MKARRTLERIGVWSFFPLLVLSAACDGSESGPGASSIDATSDSDAQGSMGAASAPDAPVEDSTTSGPLDATEESPPQNHDAGIDSAPETGPDADSALETGPDADAEPEDAPGDASNDGPAPDAQTDAGESTYSIIASIGGAACLNCASDQNNAACVGDGVLCESLDGSTADAGPGVGQSRVQLCYDTLECALTTGCMIVAADATDPGYGHGCYCGDVSPSVCGATPSAGACGSQEERGLETTNPGTVLQRFSNTMYGAAMANDIALCIAQYCQASCQRDQ